jgi:hypothetical protein
MPRILIAAAIMVIGFMIYGVHGVVSSDLAVKSATVQTPLPLARPPPCVCTPRQKIKALRRISQKRQVSGKKLLIASAPPKKLGITVSGLTPSQLNEIDRILTVRHHLSPTRSK